MDLLGHQRAMSDPGFCHQAIIIALTQQLISQLDLGPAPSPQTCLLSWILGCPWLPPTGLSCSFSWGQWNRQCLLPCWPHYHALLPALREQSPSLCPDSQALITSSRSNLNGDNGAWPLASLYALYTKPQGQIELYYATVAPDLYCGAFSMAWP